jgi:hypothetical protein
MARASFADFFDPERRDGMMNFLYLSEVGSLLAGLQ